MKNKAEVVAVVNGERVTRAGLARMVSAREKFEQACREQNARHMAQRAEARANGAACDVEIMFAFGGETYCRAHGVMGPCPYGGERGGRDEKSG